MARTRTRKSAARRVNGGPLASATCQGLTKKGSACRQPPTPGGSFCRYHGDQAADVASAALDQASRDELAAGEELADRLADGEPDPDDEAHAEAEHEADAEDLDPEEKRRLYSAIWDKLKVVLDKIRTLIGEDLTDYAQAAWYLLQNQIDTLLPRERFSLHQVMQGVLDSDILDPDFWEGLWYVLRFSVEAKVDQIGRHRRGDYEVDDFGMDEEFLDSIQPLFNFLYKVYWRVTAHGIENVPGSGRCLLACNHSGVLPFDGAMVMSAIQNDHPEPRAVRNIYLRWFAAIPFLNVALSRAGQVVASPENAQLLLEQEQLVSVFPEGIKGIGKLYKDRYKLARFGRGGFIRTAMKTQAPIVPVAIVGAEEIYPAIKRVDWLGKPLGLPYMPITPTFPLLGVFGLLPLPSKWSIDFCKPVKFKQDAQDMADDYLVLALLTEMIRKEIQTTLWRRVKRRRSLWY